MEPVVGNLTDVTGIRVGHVSLPEAATGCTVILAPQGAVAAVEVRGGAPGTRETDALAPGNLVQSCHAVLLTGGSAFGLDAAAGVMRYLEERGAGFDVGVTRVPIVVAAVLFDLYIGDSRVRPGPDHGYQACLEARAGVLPEGSVGAGSGATVGKILGMAQAMKGGVGNFSAALPGGAVVAGLAVVNAFGDVRDPDTGELLAGARDPDVGALADTAELLRRGRAPVGPTWGASTTLAVVATDAPLSPDQARWLARAGHAGLARALSPAHTLYDGDTVFALSLGTDRGGRPADLLALGQLAADAVAQCIKRAVLAAEGRGGVPGRRDLWPVGGP
ncbi:MAG: P1 family peptidase [Acetobacteraceae bacterium]|nr:P1 family peptidase [Acetobacteraceae bacterium]